MVLSFFKKKPNPNSIFSQKSYEDFYNVLLKKGFLEESQIKKIEEEAKLTNQMPEDIIVKQDLVSDEKIALAYSIVFDVPIIHLPPGPIPQDAIEVISKDTARALSIIPFGAQDGLLKIGVVNPFLLAKNKRILNEILAENKKSPQFFIIPFSDFRRAMVNYATGTLPTQKTEVFLPISLKPEIIPYNVIAKLPRELAEKYQIIVFDFIPDQLIKIAAVNPANPRVVEIFNSIKQRTGLKIEKYRLSIEDFEKALRAYENRPPAPAVSIEKKAEEKIAYSSEEQRESEVEQEIGALLEKDIVSKEELQEIVKSGHIPKIVAAVINYALALRATDVHIQPYEKKILIRYRIDGLLHDMVEIPKNLLPAIVSRIKILSKLKIDEQRIPQDGRFNVNFKTKEVDIRVSTLPTSNGEKAVLRLLDKSYGVLTLEQLGLQGKGFSDLISEIQKPYGVILATGPTGSGKTTTLYAILSRIKNPTTNIITLEDPVEYEIEGANQAQIHPEIGFSFATGLRSILRQDPNMIMVGEIRDGETASLVTHAALTGHLVLTTLHTNDASSALPRLINMGVEPFLITSAINAIVAQRLLRRICPKCQQESQLNPAVMAEIEKELIKIPPQVLTNLKIQKPYQIRRGKGCENCDNGYRGRIGIFEVLVMMPKIEDLAVRRRPSTEINQAAKELGMITMKQDGILKILQGQTTYDEVLRVISAE